jgi:hypothetical protein
MSEHDTLGFDEVPDRYSHGEKENIDLIRDRIAVIMRSPVYAHLSLEDRAFVAYNRACELKYEGRMGHKGPEEVDRGKAKFHSMMANHVAYGDPDPRSYRKK